MATVHFVGKMIDETTFTAEADLDLVLEALSLQLRGDDPVTDNFIAENFEVDAGISINAMVYETDNFIVTIMDLLKTDSKFAIKGVMAEFGCSTSQACASCAYDKKEF